MKEKMVLINKGRRVFKFGKINKIVKPGESFEVEKDYAEKLLRYPEIVDASKEVPQLKNVSELKKEVKKLRDENKGLKEEMQKLKSKKKGK